MTSDERAELLSEFELLQGKIDRVGDFAFRVKAWSISLTTAVVVGSVSGKIQAQAVWVALVGIAGFWLVAENQSAWKKAFQERCRVIDDALRRDAIWRKPTVATAWAKAATKGPPQSLVHSIDLASKSLENSLLGKIILRATTFFYIGQGVLVLAVGLYLAQFKKLDEESQELKLKQPITVVVEPSTHESKAAGREPVGDSPAVYADNTGMKND